MTKTIGMAILLASVANVAMAQALAPEIDGSSAAVAVGLLAGGLLVWRSRRKR